MHHQIIFDSMQWYIIGSAAALLTMFGFVPQMIKMYRTKSVGDVSFPMLFQFSAGVLLWMLYGIHLQDFIIIVANLVTFVTLIIAISLYFIYHVNSEVVKEIDDGNGREYVKSKRY